jgi:hypothetical protein
MAQGGAYENPMQLYSTDNVTVMAQTMARYRQSMAQSQEVLMDALKARTARVKSNREFMDRAMTPYGKAMAEAKTALSNFDQKMKGNKESLNMANQINNALNQEAKVLQKKLDEIGPNGSMAEIQAMTSEAIAIASNLKSNLTSMTEAYQEWKAAQSLPPGEKDAILANSNPQLQLLFSKMDNGEEDIILQKDPATNDWVFIPLENESDINLKKSQYQEKGTLTKLEAQETKLNTDIGNATDQTKKAALQKRLDTVKGKIDKVKSYETKEAVDYDEASKEGYKYDQTIGIVSLGDIEKQSGGTGGNYFRHVEDADNNALYDQHDQLKKDGAFQMFQRSGDDFINAQAPAASAEEVDINGRLIANKAQIADYYENKAGSQLIDSYIIEDNLSGQLEGLLGGYADDYYDNNTVNGEYVDFDNMSPMQMKGEVRRLIIQGIVDREGVAYNTETDSQTLGKTAQTSMGITPNTNSQITFK